MPSPGAAADVRSTERLVICVKQTPLELTNESVEESRDEVEESRDEVEESRDEVEESRDEHDRP